MRNLLRRVRAIHVSAAAVLVAAGVTVSLVIGGGGPTHLEIQIGGPHGTPTQTLTVPAAAVHQAAAFDEGGMRDETPAGAPATVIEAAREQQDALAANDQLPIVTPDAAPEQRGCRTELVQDYSSRRGVRPRIFVLHYTVSPNAPGWSDVNAIVGLFDKPAFAASSNYVLDGEGHCAYIVRESDKAWTQAALNPVSISVEVINTGRERDYLAKPGLEKLTMIVSDALERWKIPLQLGAVTGGVVTRPGIVDHGMLGVAGGGHHDIAPYSVAQVIDAVKAYRAAHAPKPKRAPAPKPEACTVRNVQSALNRRGAHLDVDGLIGPHTRTAIAVFERAHKLAGRTTLNAPLCKALGLAG